jgi:Animal haem peroxidase
MRGIAFYLVLLLLYFIPSAHPLTCDPEYPYRLITGECNNLNQQLWGVAGQPYIRGPEGQYYGSGFTWPVGPIPNERITSNKIGRSDPSLQDETYTNMLFTQALQFVTHDMAHNGVFMYYTSYDYDVNIGIVYPGQPLITNDSACQLYPFDPYTNNCDFTVPVINACISNNITGPAQTPDVPDKSSVWMDSGGIRYITNNANSFLDLSPIYGNAPDITSVLRTFEGGELLTHDFTNVVTECGLFDFPDVSTLGELCSTTTPVDCIDCLPSYLEVNASIIELPPTLNPLLSELFIYGILDPGKLWVSGDSRVVSNIIIATIHTLFVRNHNSLASALAILHSEWTDEKLFQEARRWNIAQYQNIVYGQMLPLVLGPLMRSFPSYSGYSSQVNPTTALTFASAAFRAYGHTIVKDFSSVDQCGNNNILGVEVPDTTNILFAGQSGGFILPLDTFAEVGSFENAIRGGIAGINAPVDIQINDVLRNVLFLCVLPGTTDLFAIDVNRGRQNGVPPYYVLRSVYSSQPSLYGTPGCPSWYQTSPMTDPIECFTNFVPYNSTLANRLLELYGKLIYIDAVPGLLSEVVPSGGTIPPTMAGIITDTFIRVRKGDRFWHENQQQPESFSNLELALIRGTTMGGLIRSNFNFADEGDAHRQVPDNPFTVPRNYKEYLQHSCGR